MTPLWLVAILISLSGCMAFPAWRDQALLDATTGRWHADTGQMSSGGGSQSSTTELYSPSGQHLGYGVTSGGTVNVYGPDGSRLGYGRR